MTSDLKRTSGRRRSPAAYVAVMDATLGLLAEQGYSRMTIEGVSARAGVSKATVYRWWPDKEHLVLEAAGNRPLDPPEITGDSERDIRAVIEAIMVYIGGPMGKVIAADVARGGDIRQRFREVVGPREVGYASVLLAAAGRGDLPHALDAETVIDLISGVVLFRTLRGRPVDTALVDQLLALVLTGDLPTVTP